MKDRTVFYGAQLALATDLTDSPINGAVPGVFAHATAFANLEVFGSRYVRTQPPLAMPDVVHELLLLAIATALVFVVTTYARRTRATANRALLLQIGAVLVFRHGFDRNRVLDAEIEPRQLVGNSRLVGGVAVDRGPRAHALGETAMLKAIGLALVLATSAAAQDADTQDASDDADDLGVVVAFLDDYVTVFAESMAASGDLVESCRFELPTDVLEDSAFLRLKIAGPDSDVWVRKSDVVLEEDLEEASLDEVLLARRSGAMATRSVSSKRRPRKATRRM